MRYTLELCLAANNILLMRSCTKYLSWKSRLIASQADRVFFFLKRIMKNKLDCRMVKQLLSLIDRLKIHYQRITIFHARLSSSEEDWLHSSDLRVFAHLKDKI